MNEGATTLRDLRNELGVASQCGQCGRCAKTMLKEHAPKPCASQAFSKQIPSPASTGVFPLFSEAMLVAE